MGETCSCSWPPTLPSSLKRHSVQWCGSSEIPATYSILRYIHRIWNIIVIICRVMKKNFFNTFEYLLVLPGCPRLLLSTPSIMWTFSDQASNQGLRSTPRSGEGKFSIPTGQNAVCVHLTSLHLLCPNSDETEPTNFAVIPGHLFCCSSLYPGIWHQDDILLWNVFFIPSSIIEHVLFNQLMQSFKS